MDATPPVGYTAEWQSRNLAFPPRELSVPKSSRPSRPRPQTPRRRVTPRSVESTPVVVDPLTGSGESSSSVITITPSSGSSMRSSPTARTAAPVRPVTALARPATAPSSGTKITTTDYGYVVAELRRILILTVIILAVLFALWFVLAR